MYAIRSYYVRSYEITPKDAYFSRRDFIKAAGVVAGSIALASCAPSAAEAPQDAAAAPADSNATDELGDPVNSFKDITNYNNYYEFSVNKESRNNFV